MSRYVIRAFGQMREQLSAHTTILMRLAENEKTLRQHDQALWNLYPISLPLLQEPEPIPSSRKRKAGFYGS